MTTAEPKQQDPVLIDVPMPIVTPRLIIRPVMAGDGTALLEGKHETWDDLCRWMIWTREGMETPEENEARVRKAYARFLLREDLWLVGVEKSTGRAAVWTGIHEIDWETRNMATGYWVRKSAQGQGYAGEACNALLRYAFNVLGANRVTIGHAEGNLASQRTIEKLGFVKEGITRKASLLPDGRLVDSHQYARLNLHGLPDLNVTWGGP